MIWIWKRHWEWISVQGSPNLNWQLKDNVCCFCHGIGKRYPPKGYLTFKKALTICVRLSLHRTAVGGWSKGRFTPEHWNSGYAEAWHHQQGFGLISTWHSTMQSNTLAASTPTQSPPRLLLLVTPTIILGQQFTLSSLARLFLIPKTPVSCVK